jgi:hypothetical protein
MRVSEARDCAATPMMSSRSMERRVKSRSKAHWAKYKKPFRGRIFRAANESFL